METTIDSKNELFRHSIATLAYRAAKTLRNPPENFASFRIDTKSRTSVEILAHMGDLIDWASSMAKGKGVWHESVPQDWESEAARFYNSLKQFDTYLASGSTIACPLEKLFQGPIADALTHVASLLCCGVLQELPL